MTLIVRQGPLSPNQRRLWLIEQTRPCNDPQAYNELVVLELAGPLTVDRLVASLRLLIERHEILRTTFHEGDESQAQRVHDVGVLDFREVNPDSLAEAVMSPFELSSLPLFRARLIRRDPTKHTLVIGVHHLLFDGHSARVLVDDLARLYPNPSAVSASLPRLSMQYLDHAISETERLEQSDTSRRVAFWRRQLAGLDGLPSVLGVPPIERPSPGYRLDCSLSQRLGARVVELSRSMRTSPFIVLLSGLGATIARWTGRTRFVLGTIIDSRPSHATEGLIGFFVDTVPIVFELSAEITFGELVATTTDRFFDAEANRLPLDLIGGTQQRGGIPLIQVVFVLQSASPTESMIGDLAVRLTSFHNGCSKFDLTVSLDQHRDGSLSGYLESPALPERAQPVWDAYERLLSTALDQPHLPISNLPLVESLVDDASTERLDGSAGESRIHVLFEQQVARTPSAIAVIDGSIRFTFDELNRCANRAARELVHSGVKRGAVVALCTERSAISIVGILAILKAGAAWLPLSPDTPAPRLAELIRAARPVLAIVDARGATAIPFEPCIRIDDSFAHSDSNLDLSGSPDDPAFVLFTSGSTNAPQGVVGPHRGMINRFEWMLNAWPFEDAEVTCQKTSLTFLDSVWEIFGPLSAGVPVGVIRDEVVRDPHRFVEETARLGVSRLVVVPSFLDVLLEVDDLGLRWPKLRSVTTSGEALPPALARRFFERLPGRLLLNLYGTTEVSADATFEIVAESRLEPRVPVGLPLPNVRVYVLDDNFQRLPPGVVGEVFVGGVAPAIGYLSPIATARSFFPDPYGHRGARMFRTGDLGFFRPDGHLELVGRRDHQLKVRGIRVNPSEIEHCLRAHGAVRQAIVDLHEDRLTAWLVLHGSVRPSSAELRTFVSKRLPAYCVPSKFVFTDTLPVNQNGKIDRQALAALAPAAVESARATSSIEDSLLSLCRQHIDQNLTVGVDFFDLGADSLNLAHLVTAIKKTFGVELRLREIFDNRTVEALSTILLERMSRT